ncbi:MAG: MjaI family restriction endonuclease [Candidatus Aenigmatarchaeota archaeon]
MQNNNITQIVLSFDEIRELVAKPRKFPKYSSPLLNLANQFSQATRPEVVGQMTELIKEWKYETREHTFESWKKWYYQKKPEGITNAVRRIKKMIKNFKEVIEKIDEELIQEWIEDLVLTQTFIGLRFQEAILKKLSLLSGKKYRMATPKEESKGIDGFIGNIPVSIKPETYKIKKMLREEIKAQIIFYKKEKNKIVFDVSNVMKLLK